MNELKRAVGALALALAGPCMAHHSYSMFDMSKPVALSGVVKEFQWTNPHCFIQLLVPSPVAPVEWSIEMISPVELYHGGLRPGTFKPGDQMSVMIAPLKDRTHGGYLLSVTDSSGRTWLRNQHIPGTPRTPLALGGPPT